MTKGACIVLAVRLTISERFGWCSSRWSISRRRALSPHDPRCGNRHSPLSPTRSVWQRVSHASRTRAERQSHNCASSTPYAANDKQTHDEYMTFGVHTVYSTACPRQCVHGSHTSSVRPYNRGRRAPLSQSRAQVPQRSNPYASVAQSSLFCPRVSNYSTSAPV